MVLLHHGDLDKPQSRLAPLAKRARVIMAQPSLRTKLENRRCRESLAKRAATNHLTNHQANPCKASHRTAACRGELK